MRHGKIVLFDAASSAHRGFQSDAAVNSVNDGFARDKEVVAQQKEWCTIDHAELVLAFRAVDGELNDGGSAAH